MLACLLTYLVGTHRLFVLLVQRTIEAVHALRDLHPNGCGTAIAAINAVAAAAELLRDLGSSM